MRTFPHRTVVVLFSLACMAPALHAADPSDKPAASTTTAASSAVKDADAWRLQAASLSLPSDGTDVLSKPWLREEAGPSSPVSPGTLITDEGWNHIDVQAALLFLAEEARDMTVKLSLHTPPQLFEYQHTEGILVDDQNLRLALEVLASTRVLAHCTDTQQHLAAALAIELLPDRYVVFDFSLSDGAVFQVRNLAVKMLESLSGRSFGGLSVGGGFKTPDWYTQAEKDDAHVIQAWKEWWQKAAPRSRTEWLIMDAPR